MSELAIIGGTGLTALDGLEIISRETVQTPYGKPSGPLCYGMLEDREIVFLPRHGATHSLPPHMINYRANIWALKQTGAPRILAVAAVGGISEGMAPTKLVIPDQLIDYTSGRSATYFEEDLGHVTHVDFSQPYCENLRRIVLRACRIAGIDAADGGVYGVTQGPRLETAAEILRMERDGCSLVGMTAMPEAVLARELDLSYASCAVVANWAAGKGDAATIDMALIEDNLLRGMDQVRRLLKALITLL